MGTENQNATTGNQAFDNVIDSVQLLHEYIYAVDDETTFAFVLGGALNDENKMHGVATHVGNLKNPPIFEAAVRILTDLMKKDNLIAKLIIEAYQNYKTKGNVKVVKITIDSPLEALMILKNMVTNGEGIPELSQLPPELSKMIADRIPDLAKILSQKMPDFEEFMSNNEPCDNPLCPVCSLKRNKGMYN